MACANGPATPNSEHNACMLNSLVRVSKLSPTIPISLSWHNSSIAESHSGEDHLGVVVQEQKIRTFSGLDSEVVQPGKVGMPQETK